MPGIHDRLRERGPDVPPIRSGAGRGGVHYRVKASLYPPKEGATVCCVSSSTFTWRVRFTHGRHLLRKARRSAWARSLVDETGECPTHDTTYHRSGTSCVFAAHNPVKRRKFARPSRNAIGLHFHHARQRKKPCGRSFNAIELSSAARTRDAGGMTPPRTHQICSDVFREVGAAKRLLLPAAGTKAASTSTVSTCRDS